MNRRQFMINMAPIVVLPYIVPSSIFGSDAPSNKINIGQIGCGRIARTHDMEEILHLDGARIIAVCDLDEKRMEEAMIMVQNFYSKKNNVQKYIQPKMYHNYRDLLNNPEVDAVVISTPDHWHAQIAIEASMKGKDVYLQKPNSLTISEGRQLVNVINNNGTILQIGTQVRSTSHQFRRAAELVRNGRIGELKSVKLSFPGDPEGPDFPEMKVPETFNYDMWLGSTPWVPYTEKGVHPQNNYDRPGWLRREQFGAGMITGWGQHQFDLANWGMDTEYTGPTTIEAIGIFPEEGLWDVHSDFMVKLGYENNLTVYVTSESRPVIRYEGSEGWIEVYRGNYSVTDSDPISIQSKKVLSASDDRILKSKIMDHEIRLYRSDNHHQNWLECIKSRKTPISPVEIGHRACSTCLLSHIAMKIDHKLIWDPSEEVFLNSAEANSMLARTQRYPYGVDNIEGIAEND